jgi:hypothetical protein
VIERLGLNIRTTDNKYPDVYVGNQSELEVGSKQASSMRSTAGVKYKKDEIFDW